MYFFSLTDIPAADEINMEINYSQEDKHISASLTFQNIYPLPQCMLSVGESKFNMSVSRKTTWTVLPIIDDHRLHMGR